MWLTTGGELRVRFGYLSELPWRLVQAHKHPMALRSRQKYLEEVALYGVGIQHRVTQRFFGEDGDLATEMLMWLDHQQMTPRLERELLAYALAPCDEAIIEGMHRDVEFLSTKARRSMVPCWSAAQRLQQNIEFVDALDDAKADTWVRCMRSWGAIGQRVPRKEQQLVPVKMPAKKLKAWVYREGNTSMSDWVALSELAPTQKRAVFTDVDHSDLAELKVGYLDAVLCKGEVFSVVYTAALPESE
jgi:hypothetical protein